MLSKHQRVASVIVDAIAAGYAVIVATGLLTIAIAVIAWINGSSVADLYTEFFPRYRGSAGPMRIPAGVQIIFIIYVVVAAQMAIFFRKRVAARLLKN
jgi:hypothetical protein